MSTTTTRSGTKSKPVKRNSYLSNLRHLTNKDVTKAAYTLLEAFAEDDLAKMLVCHIEDKAERQLCELTLYEAYIRQHIAKGIVIGQGETESDLKLYRYGHTLNRRRRIRFVHKFNGGWIR